MSSEIALPPQVASSSVFMAWGPPSYTMRTRLLAARLGMEVEHIYSSKRRGALIAPFKYTYQALATMLLLARRRPRLLFVQHPPSFAPLFAVLYGALSGADVVIDAHSDAFSSPYWSRPRWLARWMARRATTTIVTNEHQAELVRSWGAHATVVRDIPGRVDVAPASLAGDFNVTVVATFAPDEPIDEVLDAATSLPDVTFRVTGDHTRRFDGLEDMPSNVLFTGYIDEAEYQGLLAGSDAAMVLTTRNHTMQRGACEALSMGVPIITSDWPLLVDYFNRGTVYVDNSATDIARGVAEMRRHHDRFTGEVMALRDDVLTEWEGARDSLVSLVVPAGAHD